MGAPDKDRQAEYDATQRRIAGRRAKFFGQTSAVVPIDPGRLTESGRQHRAKVAQPRPIDQVSQKESILARIRSMRRPDRPQVMPFEDAKEIVQAIYESDLAGRNRQPIWTPENLIIIDDVTRYFIGDPTGPLPLEKGLFVYGPVGVGKTYLFRMMAILTEVVPIRAMQFQMVSTKRILRAISDEKSLKPLQKTEKGAWLLDDLGEEKRLTKVYGDVENPIDHLISSRNELYVDSVVITHFTSNKEPGDIEGIYGTRAYDRISEMIEPIFFNGESLRNPDDETDDDE